jgi:hypothetical protein
MLATEFRRRDPRSGFKTVAKYTFGLSLLNGTAENEKICSNSLRCGKPHGRGRMCVLPGAHEIYLAKH